MVCGSRPMTWLFVGAACAIFLVIVDAMGRKKPPAPDRDAERADDLNKKRAAAVRKMQRHKIKPITTREWISSAHEAPSLKHKASVTVIKGARHG